MTRKRAGQWMTAEDYQATETESQFQSWVTQAAREFRWAVYHTKFSVMSEPGFPDLVMVKAGHPVIYAEIKRMTGQPTAEQYEWLELLRAAMGTLAYCWWPDDRDLILRVLAGRE